MFSHPHFLCTVKNPQTSNQMVGLVLLCLVELIQKKTCIGFGRSLVSNVPSIILFCVSFEVSFSIHSFDVRGDPLAWAK